MDFSLISIVLAAAVGLFTVSAAIWDAPNMIQARHRRSPAARKRRGILSMELVLTMPILLVLLLGTFEFTCLFFTYGSVVEASRAGARQAMLHGVVDEDVSRQVRQSLGPRLSHAAEVAVKQTENPGEDVACAIRIPMTACAPNLLWAIGFDLDGRSIECATHMVKE